jgi:hypothetical protein
LPWTRSGIDVTCCRPAKQLCAENEEGSVVLEDERAIGKVVKTCLVVELRPRDGSDALDVKLRVDSVSSSLAGVELAPERREVVIVLAATKCARAVTGGERGRLVEEEELSETAGLQQRPALPAAKLELAGDPALASAPPPDTPGLVVQATAIAVDEAARRVRD